MSLYKKIVITNRKIFFESRGYLGEDFDSYAEYLGILAKSVDMIILREKDLSEKEYEKLACKVQRTSRNKGAKLFFHTYADAALRLKADGIHLPMPLFEMEMKREELKSLKCRGASAHSLEDAYKAQELGADYITLSHIFATKCKEGLEPKGTDFLRHVCEKINIPVYALGGINDSNEKEAVQAGAAGVCKMSEYMNGNITLRV